MKLRKGDNVMVIAGKDKSKTGEVMVVLPQTNQVVVAGVNKIKRHTKPDAKNPKGGVIEREAPLNVSKVMVIDPTTKRPARIGFEISAKGEKTRIYKVAKFSNGVVKAKPDTNKESTKKAKS